MQNVPISKSANFLIVIPRAEETIVGGRRDSEARIGHRDDFISPETAFDHSRLGLGAKSAKHFAKN
jgi:hypothetical protein